MSYARFESGGLRLGLLWLLAASAWAALQSPPALAGGGPENVFLVVNPRGEASLEVANNYIDLRKIPATNVFYLPSLKQRQMKGLEFKEKILRPVLAEIDKRGLHDQIDEIVYSPEFPYQINFEEMFAKENLSQTSRPFASITGATFLYQFVEDGNANLTQLNTNFYFAPVEETGTTSRAFHRRLLWSPGHVPVAAAGLSYILAASLGVTDDEGNTTEEIVDYLKRAAAADGTRPAGIFYYMMNGDVRSKARDEGFAAAVTEIRAMGLHAEIGNGVAPNSSQPLLGLTTGSANVPLRASGSHLAPGALVDNLTSAGAVMARAKGPNPQTRISEYLRLGAAGASGTVVEPYAIKEKFPAPSVHVHYARGCSMAEAFFQSVQGPYQLLIAGDPLCQPWAHIPEVSLDGITAGQLLSGQAKIKPSAKTAEGQTIARFQMFVDGQAGKVCKPGESVDLDTTKLADGYHELRVVAVDNSPIETQGRWVGGVTVKNGRDAVSISAVEGSRITSSSVTISVTSTIDGATIISHNGRELGRVTGRTGTLPVPVSKLGKGPVTIVASTGGDAPLRSQPLRLEIR